MSDFGTYGPDWVTVTWAEVMAQDTVRVPGRPDSVSVVDSVSAPAQWHTKVTRVWTDDAGRQRDVLAPHDHVKCAVRLVGRTGLLSFGPTDEIELLMDEALTERRVRAILATFPTSTPIETS